MIAALRRRLGDESGHVGILMAMALFVVVGMLMMTWNTAQLSKEKMRLQNAADSAALGFCTWQARGMNAVQNINDEMYVALSIADKLLSIAIGFETGALACEALEGVPFVGVAFRIASHAFHIIALLTGGTSGLLASRICPWILKPLGYFYAYGSAALGWWGAQQLASKNRADPIGNLSKTFTLGKSSWSLGLFAIGVSFPLADTVVLPVEPSEDEGKKSPWTRQATSLKIGSKQGNVFQFTHHGVYKKIHKALGTGEGWEVNPWVSKTEKDEKGNDAPRTPGPSVWIAYKSQKHIEALPLDQWKPKGSKFVKGVHSMPMFAVAAAQCISGDVVAHSKKPGKSDVNQRRAGFGTGATAKLVPVATAVGELNKYVGKAVGAAIYH